MKMNKTDLIKYDFHFNDLKKIGKHLYERFGIIWDYYKILYYWEQFSDSRLAIFLIVDDETLKDFDGWLFILLKLLLDIN